MKPELPIKSEELPGSDGDNELSPSMLNSFKTLPTDTQSAASWKHYGAPTLGSMNYTDSHSAEQPGGSHANQEDTAAREQAVFEEGHRRDAVDLKEAERNEDENKDGEDLIRNAMMRRLQEAVDEMEGNAKPTYGYQYPGEQIPIPISPNANYIPALPTECQINGESLSQKKDKYISAAEGGLRLPESRGRSTSLTANRYRPVEMHVNSRLGNSGNSTPRMREESPFEAPQRGRLATRRYVEHEGASRENSQGHDTGGRSRSPPTDRHQPKSGSVPTVRSKKQIDQLIAMHSRP